MKPAYDMYRPKPYSQPTTPPPTSWPTALTDVLEGAPMEKVKAPETGWLSADTTCQDTV